jgi:GDPmannose 4,6-dehydratase
VIIIRKAIIVGCNGQDGKLLYQLLEKHNYQIIGLGRGRICTNQDQYQTKTVNICDAQEVYFLIRFFQPDEVYHLAAFHHSSEDPMQESGDLWLHSYPVNTQSLLNFLEAIRLYSPHTRLFYAASSHIFGYPAHEPQDETTPINPVTIYGISKAMGLFLSRYYREKFRLFVAVGILYNHESIYRNERYISAKIIHSAIRISRSGQGKLIVGNLNAVADWGFAPDYVIAMKQILTLPNPDDFIIATGEKHTVKEFIEIAFHELGLDWKNYVEERENILTRQMPGLIGNAEKLRGQTGWSPSVTFHEMVRNLVHEALEQHEGAYSPESISDIKH